MSLTHLALPLLLAPALVVAATAAAPAQAAVVFQSPGTSQRVHFDGLTALDGVGIAGTGALDARVSLRLTATDGLTWRFSYEVANEAGGGFDKARISGFGFDLDSNPSVQPSATGTFARVGSGMVAAGFDADVCLMAAGKGCDTNSSAGIRPGDVGTGTFQLSYAQRQLGVQFSNLYVRWQGSQVDKALPARVPAVSVSLVPADPAPEPAIWAMLILGFGLVGAAARRRDRMDRRLA